MQIHHLSQEPIIPARRLQLVPATADVLTSDVESTVRKSSTKDSTNVQHPFSFAERIDRLLAAFASFDHRTADDLLSGPLQTLPTEQVCRNLLLPLLVEVGDRWHRGELSVAAEHFGTTLVRNKLMSLLGELRQTDRRFRVLCACPPGDLHEMGLLLFTLEATIQGWDTVYLGANVPTSDLVQTARKLRPTLVGLSFVMRQEPCDLRRLLTDLTTGLDGCSQLLVGGSGLRGQTEIVRRTGCLMMPESGQLVDLCPQSGTIRTPTQRAVRGKRSETSRLPKKFLP